MDPVIKNILRCELEILKHWLHDVKPENLTTHIAHRAIRLERTLKDAA